MGKSDRSTIRWVLISLLIGTILGVSIQVRAAITLDNTSTNAASDTITGISSLTWSHTANTCSNCVLFVGISTYNQVFFGAPRVLNVTYGPQAMTTVGSAISPLPNFPAIGNSSVEYFRLIAPPTGPVTINVTFSTPVNYAVGNAFSLNGVSQSVPNGTFVSSTANSDSPALSLPGAAVGDLALDVLGTTPNAGFLSENASQMACVNSLDETTCSRGRRFFSFAFDVGAMSRKTAVAPSVVMNWTLTTASSWAQGAILIKPSIITAAGVSIGGRVVTADGAGIGRAVVTLRNLNGDVWTAITNGFGYYQIGEVIAGETYVLGVSSKRFLFTPRVLFVHDNVADADMIAQGSNIKGY